MIGKFGPFEFSLADRYRFEEELGRGGMGVVYRAHDLKLDRPVAIKMLHPALTNEVGVSRFQSEIQITASLVHPRIVKVYEAGEVDGRLYYVMQYVAGETLRARLHREKQLSVDDAVRIVCEVADALQSAHDQRIVHRDVKPENILLTASGAHVFDFGLAYAFGNVDAQRLTASGLAVGSPHYLSPEQASAERHIGPPADQYALGCVLYEMLVGEPPFTGPTASAIAMRHLSDPPPPMRARRKSTSAAIEGAVLRAMEKVPADRFPTIAAFAGAVQAPVDFASLPGRVEQATPTRRGIVEWLRHPRFLATTGLVVAIGVATAAIIPRIRGPLVRDPQSIVIFPLYAGALAPDPAAADVGESAALLINYRLDGTPGIQFLNAGDHLIGAERTGQADITLPRKRDIARSLGADRIIDGWIGRHDDSVTVVLRLQPVAGGPAMQKGFTSVANTVDAPRVALSALRALLPAFLDPNKSYDPIALDQRDPAAIAAFLEGERAYRDSRFEDAIARYEIAEKRDSLLAVAALKAAQAASWLNRPTDAVEHVNLALRHIDLLPPRYALFANGLQFYLRGDGDSAVAFARRLVDADPHSTDAWFLLGEAAFHLVSSLPPAQQEATADSAFRRAAQSDTSFAPAREHLLDLALRHADLARIDSLGPMVRRGLEPDDSRWLDAIVRCVRAGPSSVDWRSLRDRNSQGVWRWGSLVFEPARARCTLAAFQVTIASREVESADLWGAVVGTNAVLVAAGKESEASRLLSSPVADKVRGWALLFPDAAAGVTPADRLVAKKVDSLGPNFDALATPHLWLLTSWYSTRGDTTALGAISRSMTLRRDSTHRHRDSLVADVAAAHYAVARHDTASALRILQSLRAVAVYTDLMFQPWEALAGERILEASLLAGTGRPRDAIRTASRIDAQVPMNNLVYLRRSLELRATWATQLGDTAAAAGYRERLAQWKAALP